MVDEHQRPRYPSEGPQADAGVECVGPADTATKQMSPAGPNSESAPAYPISELEFTVTRHSTAAAGCDPVYAKPNPAASPDRRGKEQRGPPARHGRLGSPQVSD